jgi:hypothetical protein
MNGLDRLLILLVYWRRLKYHAVAISLVVADSFVPILLDHPFTFFFLLNSCSFFLMLSVLFNQRDLIDAPEFFVLGASVVD